MDEAQRTDLARRVRQRLDGQDPIGASRILCTVPRSDLPQGLRSRLEVLSDPTRLPPGTLEASVRAALDLLERQPQPDRDALRVFIVHGRDEGLKYEIKDYLARVLACECVILHQLDGAGGTLIDKFEGAARTCDVAVVLLSDRDDPHDALMTSDGRPRPNVFFEMGFFFGYFGRSRTVLFVKGKPQLNSDIFGIEYIDVTGGAEAAGELIRRRFAAWLD